MITTRAYDALNRLTNIASLVSQTTAPTAPKLKLEFTYDAQGRRLQKLVSPNNGTGYFGQTTNCFAYDGWNLLTVLSPQLSSASQYFYWGLDLSGTLQGAGGVGGLLKMYDSASATHNFVGYDGNGNVSVLVNGANGQESAQYEYGPLGELQRATGLMAKANPFRFSTKYQDDETDLLFYGYRFYNASTGRWPNRDPIAENGGVNVYAFVSNNGANYYDMLGLLWFVNRDGGSTASAVPENGDTVADLARAIGLNPADYRRWLTLGTGTSMPISATQPLTSCDKFEIPNTVVAYWAGDLGWVGQWWVRWNSSIEYLEKRGFNVDDRRHQKGNTWALQTSLQSKAAGKELHGLYFWGHGSMPYPAQYLVSSDGDALLEFSSVNLSYKMALALVFACDSNAGQSALSSGTSGSIWKGFSGTLVPWPFRQYHAKHYIKPFDQETW